MFATKSDIDRRFAAFEREIDRRFDALDQRLSVIQWIGIIFLGLNAAMLSAFLWAVAGKIL